MTESKLGTNFRNMAFLMFEIEDHPPNLIPAFASYKTLEEENRLNNREMLTGKEIFIVMYG